MVDELRTSIQENGQVVVLGVGGHNFEPPITMTEFQNAVTANRIAIEDYFNKVIEAQKDFSAKIKSDENVEALAGILRKGLIDEFQKLHGITIHEVRNTEAMSQEEIIPEEDHATKVWAKYAGTKDVTDPNDVRRQEIVKVITTVFTSHYNKTRPRAEQAMSLENVTAIVFNTLKNLDPRWEDHIMAIMIAEGWRVVKLFPPTESPGLLPFGKGVPTCAKDSKDHPIWDGL